MESVCLNNKFWGAATSVEITYWVNGKNWNKSFSHLKDA
jgi:hypothetical protein